MKFVGELVPRSTRALAERIAALDHEIGDDAVKDRAVVVRLLDLLAAARVGPLLAALGEPHEIGHRVGRFGVEQLCGESALTRREMRVQHWYALSSAVEWWALSPEP